MAEFKDRLIEALEYRNMSAAELARLSQVNEGAISQYKKGAYKATQENLEKLAKTLKVSIPWLMGADTPMERAEAINGIMPVPKMIKKPRLGVISCGEPILAEENLDGYDYVPEDVHCDFTLQCKGDSMINARINDGDVVYIKAQPMVENGQIAAVMIDNEATLKRVFISDNKIVLQAENPKYEPWVYVNEELNTIRILGKAVGFTSKL